MNWARAVTFICFGLLSACASSLGRSPDDVEPEFYDDLLHADLPLFGSEADKSPYAVSDEKSFGCASRVGFGDWRYDREDRDDDESKWFRVTNYGVFHCWANVARADGPQSLETASPRPSFFVELGTVNIGGKAIELWALQLGARPGSDYVLLARAPGESRVEEFNVLQMKCPARSVRDSGGLSILITRYCAINDPRALKALARNMARLPPLGRMVYVRPVKETD